jgi:hypothetical protein
MSVWTTPGDVAEIEPLAEWELDDAWISTVA